MFSLAIIFGAIIGFALGLTGGGGGVFAVPLLVYGMSFAPREAVGVSLAAVGGTALLGVAPRLIRGEVELRTGVLFAVAGMLGAPLGTSISGMISETLLLTLFGLLMFVVAWRLWAKTRNATGDKQGAGNTDLGVKGTSKESSDSENTLPHCKQPTCQRDETGELKLTSKCAVMLAAVGFLTGVLSGMFGVGGGFVIVPALVLFSGMKIHQAIATSLLVIVLVSISGVTSYVAAGHSLPWKIAALFLLGGFFGIWVGGRLSTHFKGPTLQKVFAGGVVFTAAFVFSKTILSTSLNLTNGD